MPAPTRTFLLVASQGLDPAALRQLTPPGTYLLGPEPLPWPGQGPLDYGWQLPAAALAGLREIVPCLCSPASLGYRFSLEYELASMAGVHRVDLDPVGAPVPPPAAASPPAAGPAVRAEVDLLRVEAPLRRATVRVAATTGAAQAPCLLAISLRQAAGRPPTDRGPAALAAGSAAAGDATDLLIDVPARSQMRLAPALARRVCSPTCISMLLAHYGQQVPVEQVIDAVYHRPSGLYGVWPANIQAAARYGLLGLLLHFADLAALEFLLRQKVPVVASVRFEPGELQGAPIRRSSGHLLVLCGTAGDRIVVNDPAAPDDGTVRRSYARRDLERVWLDRAALGYVLVPAALLVGRPAAATGVTEPAGGGRRHPLRP